MFKPHTVGRKRITLSRSCHVRATPTGWSISHDAQDPFARRGRNWALLEAMALRDLYGDIRGRGILKNFDLAVANSGGSIVLAGLIEDMKPSEIIDLFSDPIKRQSIFVSLPLVKSLLSHIPIFPETYSAAGKLEGLKAAFGPMGDTYLENLPVTEGWPLSPNEEPVKILIVGFDYDRSARSFLGPMARCKARSLTKFRWLMPCTPPRTLLSFSLMRLHNSAAINSGMARWLDSITLLWRG